MLNIVGQKFIFAVAQRPFEASNVDSGILNQFCALLPVFDWNGDPANSSDFPDNGDVWWMVRPGARGLAEPGRLVTGIVEDSIKKGQSGFSQFQVNADNVEAVRGRDYVEIIDIPATAISEARDLIGSSFRLGMDHVPIDTAYVRWRNELIGRFRTTTEESETAGQWDVKFRPESGDGTVLRVSKDLLEKIPQASQFIADITVSLEDRPLHLSRRLNQCHYHLVETEVFNESVPVDVRRISLRTDEQVIQQLAKRLLTRNKRQQLMTMLEELDELAAVNSSELTVQEDRSVVMNITKLLSSDTKSIGDLAKSIVETGLVEDRVNKAIDDRVEKHIAENAAKLQSEVNKKVAETRAELESLNKDRIQIHSELQNLRARKTKELDQELAKVRTDFEREQQKQDEYAKKQLAELKRQEKLLSNNLEKVAANLALNRDEVVNQFLTIAPLLDQFGLLPGRKQSALETDTISIQSTIATRYVEQTEVSQQSSFVLPSFTIKTARENSQEEVFFDRFRSHVENCGFRYREIDLLSYHISVKCGDLTILGGLPGTGKSSLPRLYAQAVHGEGSNDECERFLHVAVSPSWLDMRDLIGHVNALNQTFQPADSSLFQHLVFAEEEFRQTSEESGLYFVCLDEMNLSHVEHYFSSLLQVLEHPDSERRLRCFPEHVVDPKSPFGPWSSIQIPRTVRFIGTVNFDETTRQLSQRLLDRANMIRLPSNQLPLELEESSSTKATDEPVRLRDYRSWIRNTATYSDELATLIDDLRDDLRMLNCPMNPRRFSAIRRFLASWPESIAPMEKAVDLQFAQRVLPQIRGLFQPGVREAVISIRRKLENHSLAFSESLRVLDEINQSDFTDLFLEPEVKA